MKVVSYFLSLGIFFSAFSCTNQNRISKTYDTGILLKLIDKRLQVAPLVAKSKWNTKVPIDDPIREKNILDSVEVKAGKLGVDKKFARNFFQAQFTAGKIVQKQLLEQWENQNQMPFNPVPDLGTQVRPVLDSLTPLLLIELEKIKPNSCRQESLDQLKIKSRQIINIRFDDHIVKTAVKPIEDYCKTRN
ncbi:gamma subclass chorismate mutase AroQ [Chryseobacterium sp. JUb7]|uniref:gamma subclass chorismate mutase AroQ n=1 Tax=Chryseobacterium sp. JUb7 TaxID=2940599 RepID=UPI002169BFD3|nr:gamma subclass chorismate mutase AroQ [Chryseobacterium sp. JUb7]MCS3530602.1 chorismate mutase [Chryseobacterium sp. JUb7]